MSKLSIRDLDLKNKTVFIRVDFNVPLAPGGQEITSDKRIRASLPTIRYALDQGAGVILASHLGRPKGKPNPEMSLKPAAKRLAELLGQEVRMAPDCVGPEVEKMRPKPGGVLLLENLAVSCRRREERSGVLETVGVIVRRVRERRIRFGASCACFHGGDDSVRTAGCGRVTDGQGTGVSEQGD